VNQDHNFYRGLSKMTPLNNLEFTPFVLPTLVDSEDISESKAFFEKPYLSFKDIRLGLKNQIR